jgi:hypothetical protein
MNHVLFEGVVFGIASLNNTSLFSMFSALVYFILYLFFVITDSNTMSFVTCLVKSYSFPSHLSIRFIVCHSIQISGSIAFSHEIILSLSGYLNKFVSQVKSIL